MDLYDIINLEDTELYVSLVRRAAESHHKTYLVVGTLQELQSCLQIARATTYILDSNFPDHKGGIYQFLVQDSYIKNNE